MERGAVTLWCMIIAPRGAVHIVMSTQNCIESALWCAIGTGRGVVAQQCGVRKRLVDAAGYGGVGEDHHLRDDRHHRQIRLALHLSGGGEISCSVHVGSGAQ